LKTLFFKYKQNAFTLLEAIIILAFLILLLFALYALYINISHYSNRQIKRLELAQNSRIILDRMSREIRQTSKIISILPETKDEEGNPPLNEIKFQNGHNLNPVQYIRYYQDNFFIKRTVSHYFFSVNPDLWVVYDSVDTEGNPPIEEITEDEVIGEYIDSTRIYGKTLVTIEIDLIKDQEKLYLKSRAGGRNL